MLMSAPALFVLVALATLAPGGAVEQVRTPSGVAPAERLWVGKLASHILASEADAVELKVIEQLCGPLPAVRGDGWDQWVSCSLQHHKGPEGPIATIYAEPNLQSGVVAVVHEGWSRNVSGEIERVWLVELRQQPGVFSLWPESSWASGYGLNIAGFQVVGEWARLLKAAPVDGWLQLSPNSGEGARYYFHVYPIAHQILNLIDVVATDPQGQTRSVKRGAYLILSVENDMVEFRAEVPSDFSCGGAAVDPEPLPPVLRATSRAFFDSSGSARFSTTYSKGC